MSRDSQELRPTALRDIQSFCEDSSIKDVMDAISKGAEIGKEWLNYNKRNTGSIVRRASDLVLVFPVLVSSSLKFETAVLISKAIEKKCVALLQVLFSAMNLTQYKDTKDLYDYLAKFHTNLNYKGGAISLDDFITAMDAMSTTMEMTITDKDAYDAVMAEMREINDVAKDALRETSVNDFDVTRTLYGNVNVTLEASNKVIGVQVTDPNKFTHAVATMAQGEARKAANNEFNKRANDMASSMKDNATFFKNQIVSSDTNKANELSPTVMMVNFVTMVDGTAVNRTGVIGVKAKMYPVDGSEIVGRLSSKYTEGNTLFNLIRCSTKEKSFFKDFAFAIEKTKLDAINIAKGSINTRLFRTLENRAKRNSMLKLLQKGDASPITTLIISQEEVEYLKKYSNMDMEKPNTARVIMNGYNLMGIVIVDDSLEIAKFLYDDDEGMFETLTYDALAKEDKNGDYKKIINLMSKINR